MLRSELKLRTCSEEEKLMSRALQFWRVTLSLKFKARPQWSIAAKMSLKCWKTKMPIKQKKELKFLNRFKPWELRLVLETRRLEIFLPRSTQSSLRIKLLREKMSLLKWASMSSKRYEPDNRARFTNKMVHFQNGNKNALRKAHASQFLRKREIHWLIELAHSMNNWMFERKTVTNAKSASTTHKQTFQNSRVTSTVSILKSTI